MLLREKDYQRGQSALENKFQNFITYFEIIPRRNSFKFSPKQSHADSRKFYLCAMIRHGLSLIILKKDTPIFFDDYQN